MPGSHALPTGPPLSAIERPRCPHCQSRTTLACIALRTPHVRVPQMWPYPANLGVSDPM